MVNHPKVFNGEEQGQDPEQSDLYPNLPGELHQSAPRRQEVEHNIGNCGQLGEVAGEVRVVVHLFRQLLCSLQLLSIHFE